jgi:aspartate aminotransferase, cytoplasmic
VYISDPTWGTLYTFLASFTPSKEDSFPSANHAAIMKNVGIEPVSYRYYNPQTIGLDFDGMISALQSAPEKSVILLHACAHNPTGVDPTIEQWAQIADVMLQKAHYAFFDCAYQGFASGDLDRDAAAVSNFQAAEPAVVFN